MNDELDKLRARELAGLMAETAVSALEHSVFRSLLYLGKHDNRSQAVRCSFAWLGERGGRDNKRSRGTRDENRGVNEAFHRLCERGWLTVSERERGGTFRIRISAPFGGMRAPAWQLAPVAIKRISMQVSPVGPTLERSYCRLLWALNTDACAAFGREEWCARLGVSRSRGIPHLQKIAAADVGVQLTVIPPPAHDGRGHPGPIYSVRVRLPETGSRPDGAARHREFLHNLAPWTDPAGSTVNAGADTHGAYADSPTGLVWIPFDDVDETLPWDD